MGPRLTAAPCTVPEMSLWVATVASSGGGPTGDTVNALRGITLAEADVLGKSAPPALGAFRLP